MAIKIGALGGRTLRAGQGKNRQLAAGKPLPIYESLEGLGGKSLMSLRSGTYWSTFPSRPTPGHVESEIERRRPGFVAVPNHESYDARHYKQHWAYDVPRHFGILPKPTWCNCSSKMGWPIGNHPHEIGCLLCFFVE